MGATRQENPREQYVFGEFELDASSLELRRAGERVALQRRPLQLLLYLSRHANRMVPSAELLREVWEEVTVTEASLRGAIRVLRRELAGSATIEILRGYGYRFVPSPGRAALNGDPKLGSTADLEIGTLSPRMVGRRAELASIEQALARAVHANSQPIFLTGGAGMGKTRLSRAASERAHSLGFRVLWGQCWDGTGSPAFWPWSAVLEQLDRETAGLLEAEAAPSRFRLFANVANLLRRRAEQEPLLLILEDIHWAADSSLLLLKFVVEQLQNARLLVVVTYRETDLSARSSTSSLVGSIQARGHLMPLRPLTLGEVTEFLETGSSLDVTPELADSMLRWTGGNPLFVRELIPVLEQHRDDPHLARLNVPAGIRQAIRAHLGPLGDETRRVLTAAAVLGESFEARTLHLVTGSPVEAQEVLSRAVARGVLSPSDSGNHRFAHALIREELISELTALERATLHHRIATALEELPTGSSAHAAAIAFHFEQALPVLPNPDLPIRKALEAAGAAMSRFAYEQAREHCRAALRLAESYDASLEQRGEVLVNLGEALRYCGESEEAKSVFIALADLGRKASLPLLLAEGARGFGRAHAETGVVNHSLVDLLAEALAALPGGDSPIKAELLTRLGRALTFDLDWKRRYEQSDLGLKMAERLGDRETLAAAMLAHAYVAWGSPDLEVRRAWPLLIRQGIEVAENARSLEALAMLRSLKVTNHLETGDTQHALAELECYNEIALRLQHPVQLYFVRSTRAAVALLTGQLASARDLIDEAWESGRCVGPLADGFRLLQITILKRELGDLRHFLPQIRTVQASAVGQMSQVVAAALVFAECGLVDDARAEMERLMASGLEEQLFDPNWLPWFVIFGRIVANVGSREHASSFYDLLLPYERYTGVCGSVCAVTGITPLTLAALARGLGALDRALAHAEAALHYARRMNAIPEEARCQLELAHIHRLRGRPELVTTPLEAARRIATEIGMKGVLREIAEFESNENA